MHRGQFAIADETGQVRTGLRDTPEQPQRNYKRRVAPATLQAVEPGRAVEPAPPEPVADSAED